MATSNSHDTFAENSRLRSAIADSIASGERLLQDRLLNDSKLQVGPEDAIDLLLSHAEVSEKHGTGILTKRIFADQPRILSIRSMDLYDGKQNFGAESYRLSQRGLSQLQLGAQLLGALKGRAIRRIVCIPYFPDEVRLALIAHSYSQAPLCTYIMDDQNIYSDAIPDTLLKELFARSSLCLAISAEMQRAYEDKFGCRFWLLPPVVSDQLPVTENPQLEVDPLATVVVGNIWGRRWLQLLRATVRGSGVKVSWRCNCKSTSMKWLEFERADLKADGIELDEFLPESKLVPLLRSYAFVLVPSGTLDSDDDQAALARLSLPSRIPFILSTSHTPIIVLGSRQTVASQFVESNGIGVTAAYTTESFQAAVQFVTSTENQALMRQNAARLAPIFSAAGTAEWIWNSLALGAPCSDRFEKLNENRKTVFAAPGGQIT
ncbi:hypothetical protein [Gloeobacter kilaueensis]|uniref:Uncharacterized protein n=1 Tax=Gloeobacter kilaueensis (strain ATCC BAA-2537 / CCAP 1431/1 / ULC 316 / JS1) TaxID=1183438 RepID=U5QN60_GLOK1|nr:hypothetical protein [Gloeobacter kilaueensis]AGY60422.1 hypothetical protein GKIL_4176 [Gloeobacter kilaueensis JS1]